MRATAGNEGSFRLKGEEKTTLDTQITAGFRRMEDSEGINRTHSSPSPINSLFLEKRVISVDDGLDGFWTLSAGLGLVHGGL